MVRTKEYKSETPSTSYEPSMSDNTSITKKYTSEFKDPRKILSVSILFCVNLLNYMDRYTIAGVLTNIQSFYHINDAQGGLLQTVFIIFFMLCSPLVGYLGDRYSRKNIMLAGISVWVGAVVASTFVPEDKFWLFLVFRGIVGVGEASYAIVSPSLIADMFTSQNRSKMLMVFYFAIPCGSGLGFIVGSSVTALTGQWGWGVRVTAVIGVVCLAMIVLFIREPQRGAAEREKGEIVVEVVTTNYWEDIKALLANLTYIFGTIAYTAIVFVVGTLTFWGPTAVQHSEADRLGFNSTTLLDPKEKVQINFNFGLVTFIGGVFGVSFGSALSMMLRTGWGPFRCVKTIRSDPIVCGLGALLSIPCLYLAIHFIRKNVTVCYVLTFFTITTICFNWATVVDMLMTVVPPARRSAANSWQMLLSHLLGDASGPYVIGIISDAIRGDDDSPYGHYVSLSKAFYLPNALQLISAVVFFVAACTFVRDHNRFKEAMGVLHCTEKSLQNGPSIENGEDNRGFATTEKEKGM
ncbi:unnamed protein product [Cylicocyclus nassatus]|uniref:Major facilitator superfamily (MFS) profile domain-containing protein n=1 Tax=Cylicocyclus nassatus TaxID=53992 RepID=A0AA36DM92_CYLNA|nr:unnamed protein product [Cylicocyclus nassatus]